jgi:hypothetical protein
VVLLVTAGAILAATGSASGRGATGTKPCRNTQLSASMTHIFGSEGAGSTGYRLTLTNKSHRRCWVHEHLGLQLVSARSVKLPTHVNDFGRHGVVTIAAGRKVSARLRFSPDIPGPGEPGTGPCEPQAHRVIVFLGPPHGGGVTGAVKPPTSVCEHGTIAEEALR